MAVESPEEPAPKKSVKTYASKVFKESSVSIVSSIVATGNVRRKVFRILVFLLFTVGFLYQCIKFLCYMLQYPTVVNIEMSRPKEYMAPAYTFCNYNIIKRSGFCETFPDKCTDSDEKLCQEQPRYCEGNTTTKVPIKGAWNILGDAEYVLQFGHDVKDFLVSKAWENASGPFLRENLEEGTTAPCYSIGERIDSNLTARYIGKMGNWKFPNDELEFDPEEHEKFFPNSKPGMLFSVHNPFEAVNPFEQGTFMRPGYLYRITIQKVIEELLPYPYKTDCVNYTDVWLKANKTGPRSQEMCRHKCLRDISERCFNCTDTSLLYPKISKYCNKAEGYISVSDDCIVLLSDAFDSCGSNCKDDCVRSKFSYEVQETYLTQNMFDEDEDESRKIRIVIYYDDSETLKIRYRPQYQEVETFSYIGGFIGIWLGISLVQVADVFESLFLIGRYFFRKGSGACSRKAEKSTEGESI
ncbi:hypothetical protein AVEN_115864-1 [Araneus ventricosus]|uniref:Uncharacterized protein n=1 Tax=Araneus ventricosus TaxID=182803 RepID=A0A4Y2K4I7_ARAVE|nr:hypothetical protein AVEN_115864-1 [Araneus ventricosus]